MLKVIELFGGIGSPRMALEMLGIEHTSDYVEIDKYAVKSYNAIYGEEFMPTDVTKYYTHSKYYGETDLLFHGSPCQDFSIAGKQAGGEEGSGTRSSLLWETIRIVKETKPKWIIWENVPNVLNKKHKPVVDKYIEELKSLGYTSEYKILNAIDYGIPQHRKRVFCVSNNIGKVIKWPEPFELQENLHDKLEAEPVEEKYYYSEEQSKDVVLKHQGESYCIDANYFKGTSIKNFQEKGRRQLVQVPGELGINGHDILKRVYDPKGSSPTLNAMTGGNRQPKVIVGTAHGVYTDQMSRGKANMEKEASVTIKAQRGHAGVVISNIKRVLEEDVPEKYYLDKETIDSYKDFNNVEDLEGSVELPAIAASRGRNPKNPGDRTVGAQTKQRLEINQKGNSNTITSVQKDNYVLEPYWRIRKLTPKECWRLTGFPDWAFDKAEQVNSNTQLYKQAGNSIVTNVIVELYKANGIGVS